MLRDSDIPGRGPARAANTAYRKSNRSKGSKNNSSKDNSYSGNSNNGNGNISNNR